MDSLVVDGGMRISSGCGVEAQLSKSRKHCSEGISPRARRSWPWHPDSYSVTVCECHEMNGGTDQIASCIVGGVTCAGAGGCYRRIPEMTASDGTFQTEWNSNIL